MSDVLLDVVPLEIKKQEDKLLAWLELRVDPALAPFLVSSTRSVVWIDQASKEGFVRVALRSPNGIQGEIVATILDRAVQEDWGNVYSLSEHGLQEAAQYLQDQGANEVDLLMSPSLSDQVGTFLPDQWEVKTASWLPLDTLIVVPRDRTYLGTFGTLDGNVCAIVHHPERAIAICIPTESVDDEGTSGE